MQTKLKIERITLKEGIKDNKPWKRVSVLCNGKWYGCFASSNPAVNEWKTGDEITVNVEESTYNGQPQYNIVFPRASGGGGGGAGTVAVLKEILEVQKQILKALERPVIFGPLKESQQRDSAYAVVPPQRASKHLAGPPPFSDADMPVPGDDDELDIPF